MSRRQYDVLVCGGGVAGAAAAGLMASQGRKVALIDLKGPPASLPEDDFDPRVVALSPASAAILNAAGGWSHRFAERLAAYDRMQVTAGPSRVEFKASEHGLAQLGWIGEIPALQIAQWQALKAMDGVELITHDPIEAIDFDTSASRRCRVQLASGQVLRVKLLVAADGARSRLRQQAGIPLEEWHYNQAALIGHVRTEQPNPGIAWQRFTADGPLALLPLADGRSSIVWSQPQGLAARRQQADVDAFINDINDHQDSPFGRVVDCGERHLLPLVRRRAGALLKGRLVLLGDAARTVHPLAGQGLNLGLADAACLAEVLENQDLDQAPTRALSRYNNARLSASSLVGGGIHLINEVAHLPGASGRGLLGLGFAAAARLWPARDLFVRRACGLDSSSPQLGRRPLDP
ncbi:MAG: FAD-dependent monooxygenase [Wenzhouxiangella sp.]